MIPILCFLALALLASAATLSARRNARRNARDIVRLDRRLAELKVRVS